MKRKEREICEKFYSVGNGWITENGFMELRFLAKMLAK